MSEPILPSQDALDLDDEALATVNGGVRPDDGGCIPGPFRGDILQPTRERDTV